MCSKAFLSQSCLKRHFTIAHSEKVFRCVLCQTKFPNKKALSVHDAKTHAANTQRNLSFVLQNVQPMKPPKSKQIYKIRVVNKVNKPINSPDTVTNHRTTAKIKNPSKEGQEIHSNVPHQVWVKDEIPETSISNNSYQEDPLNNIHLKFEIKKEKS